MSAHDQDTDVDALNRVVSNAAYEESDFAFMNDDDAAEGLYADVPGIAATSTTDNDVDGDGDGDGYLDVTADEEHEPALFGGSAPARKGGSLSGSSYYDVIGKAPPSMTTAFGAETRWREGGREGEGGGSGKRERKRE